MAITSIAELERAREVLASRPAAELADFILSLATLAGLDHRVIAEDRAGRACI